MTKIKIIRTLMFAAVAVVSASTPGFAVDIYLRAAAFNKPMPGVAAPGIPMWGFALENSTFDAGTLPSVPGPELVLPEGETTLTIHLRNNLTEALTGVTGGVPVSLVIPGQTTTASPVAPVKFDPGDGRMRIRSFAPETPPDNLTEGTYQWSNLKPGSYVYHSGTHPAVQVQMGLYGAMILDLLPIMTYSRAYPTVAYSDSVTLFYSEIDPALHTAVSSGNYGPTGTMTSTIDYEPKYFLVNGQSYNPASPPSALNAGTSGGGTLLRIFNMGLQSRYPLLLNSYMSQVAEHGQPAKNPKEQYVAFLSAGKTIDAQVAFPAAGMYHIFDRGLGLTNSAATNGGMRTDLTVAAGGAWPVITSVTATPASIPDTGSTALAVTTADPVTSYVWSGPGGIFTDGTTANATWEPPFAPGTHTYTLQVVVGNAAGIDIGTVDVKVTGNVAPVIASVTATPMALVSDGSSTQLQVNATDADGPAPMTYAWDDGGAGGLFSDAGIPNPTYTPVALSAGDVTLTVQVTDGALATSADSVNLTVVTSNTAPVIDSITPAFGIGGGETSAPLSVTASDADSPPPLPLTYNWTATAGSFNDPTSPTPTFTAPDVAVETIVTLTVGVSDGIATTSGTIIVTVTPTNAPPVINSVTATPNPVLDTDTSALSVDVTNSDGDPLTYAWTVPAGGGSVSNAAIANPVYTPPDIVGVNQTYTLTVEVSDGVNPSVSQSVDVTVIDALVLSANFTTGLEGFSYVDDAFNDTAAPAYEDGVWTSGAGAGGALQLTLGDLDNNLVGPMSGGWTANFDLPGGGNVVLSFRYNLTQSPHYEADEDSEVLLDVDAERVPPEPDDFVARISGNGNGGPSRSTGWQTFSVPLTLADLGGVLHTITVGGYNTQKDRSNEYTTVLIDDVLILRDY